MTVIDFVFGVVTVVVGIAVDSDVVVTKCDWETLDRLSIVVV